ncbi:S8 family serine peptidase [Asanoa siamensis]|uniref:Peptidase S8/S53 domain-containing protein n=1 Tax=Asanoa siamensis TaxID=926357 RepID=A0ABQ4CR52_9ACTN|nr:hypothetical protein Asi02nite_32890 [Asanoa siamensis]
MNPRSRFLAATLTCLIGASSLAAPGVAHAAARCGPNVVDPLAEAPWPLTRLRPDLAWPLSTGVGVKVAVIDSGVSANHPALAGKVLPGHDFLTDANGSNGNEDNRTDNDNGGNANGDGRDGDDDRDGNGNDGDGNGNDGDGIGNGSDAGGSDGNGNDDGAGSDDNGDGSGSDADSNGDGSGDSNGDDNGDDNGNGNANGNGDVGDGDDGGADGSGDGAGLSVRGGGDGGCDENGHGTLIAGIIAGGETVSSGFRFHGVAPGARIVPIRVLRDQRRSVEPGLSGDIADAIRLAVDEFDADVINLSLTTPPTAELAAAVAHAIDERVVVVAAAGNTGESGVESGRPTYPAAYPGVLAVASVNAEDRHVASSTAGDFVDVAAPGERIAGPAPAGGGYLFSAEGGTSFATGYVSGVAALIRAYDRGLSPAEVADRIVRTADHPSDLWNAEVGHGVVNPVRAVGALDAPAAAAAGEQSVRNAPPPPSPLGAVSTTAVVVAVLGVALALLILAAVPIVRRGRRRAWRAAGR